MAQLDLFEFFVLDKNTLNYAQWNCHRQKIEIQKEIQCNTEIFMMTNI